MKALVLENFGQNNFSIQDVPSPSISEDEVLIKVHYAGIGQWDQFERDGGYHELLNMKPKFPYILGSEGSGEIVKTGVNVRNFDIGELVYACSFLNQKGGFYAEYVSVHKNFVKKIPENISMIQASSILGVGITALRGIHKLSLTKNDHIIVHGASGGVGHIAVQLAKHYSNEVLGIASGQDGVQMCESLNISSIDGKIHLNETSFGNFNKILLTTSMEKFTTNMEEMKKPTYIAYPVGNYKLPELNDENILEYPYYGELTPQIINEFHQLVINLNLTCQISKVFNLNDFNHAYQTLENHYIGKLCFEIKL